jgi:hypothetical protein
MKFNISKEWLQRMAKLEQDCESVECGTTPDEFSMWFICLKGHAEERGLGWLIGDPESHRESFDEGVSPEDELSELIAEANRNA